jgi:hypothetical protein
LAKEGNRLSKTVSAIIHTFYVAYTGILMKPPPSAEATFLRRYRG